MLPRVAMIAPSVPGGELANSPVGIGLLINNIFTELGHWKGSLCENIYYYALYLVRVASKCLTHYLIKAHE